MNIGWILLLCALVILMLLAIGPWMRRGRTKSMADSNMPDQLATLDSDPAKREQVIRLLLAGQKINAIKVYRANTGASLKDAKAAVEHIELALHSGSNSLAEGQAFSEIQASAQPLAPGNSTPLFTASDVELFTAEIERLLIAGQKINAIKRYRELTGAGLQEAKDAVERLEGALLLNGSLLASQGSGISQDSGSRVSINQPGDDVRRLVAEGKKIQAIKVYREQTGASLKDAKDAVDLIQ